jgi:hypothetical protein
MKKIAILQSNYIPWKGYFDLIAAADEFILFDDMQYTRRDWRNRNLIKTPQGLFWLTIPVIVKGRYHQRINETEMDGLDWMASHWKTICQNYRKAPCFDDIAAWLEPLYRDESVTRLSPLNRRFLQAVCDYLGITTPLRDSSEFQLSDGKTQRLVDLCVQAGATEYISGPAAKDYIELQRFKDANIALTWFDYSGYPEYPQLWGEFSHGVSILDLLFNCGKQAPRYMKYVQS